jgi:hypothetical protein
MRTATVPGTRTHRAFFSHAAAPAGRALSLKWCRCCRRRLGLAACSFASTGRREVGEQELDDLCASWRVEKREGGGTGERVVQVMEQGEGERELEAGKWQASTL